MKNIALVPARGGSKRLPRKNIRKLNGKPLIGYTIEACLSTKLIDRVIVSTDDEEISKIAQSLGAEAPFLRPSYLAADDIGDRDVMLHLIDWLEIQEKQTFDNLLYMRPTTPFKTPYLIEIALKKLKNSSYSSIRSVSRAEGVYHPYWMHRDNSGFLESFIEGVKLENYYQNQLLPKCFRLNGVVDITRVNILKKHKNIYGNSIGFIEIEEKRAVDIDTEFDFMLCEFMMKEDIIQ